MISPKLESARPNISPAESLASWSVTALEKLWVSFFVRPSIVLGAFSVNFS